MAFAFNLNLSVCSARGRITPRGELSMSWLDDEANTNKQKESDEAHHREVVQRSNYWAAILQCIEREVQAINSHDYWKTKLAGFPLRLEQPYGFDGHVVSK